MYWLICHVLIVYLVSTMSFSDRFPCFNYDDYLYRYEVNFTKATNEFQYLDIMLFQIW